MKYAVSDTHWFHKRILEFCPGRPGGTVPEMNRIFKELWNNRVQKTDEVYHLGDLGLDCTSEELAEYMANLNGIIHVIRGNHDHSNRIAGLPVESIEQTLTIKWNHHLIHMSHFPMMVWDKDKHGAWHLHGHCHGGLAAVENPVNPGGKYLDVGVDGPLGIGPISFEEIEKYMENRPNRTRGAF